MRCKSLNSLTADQTARMALPLAIVVLCAMAASSDASIVQLDFAADADDVLAVVEQGSEMSSSTAPAEESRNSTPPRHEEETPDAPFALSQGAPNSGGSTSSSPGGASTGGALSFVLNAEIVVDDDETSMRLAIGQSFSLPTPRGIDLLRPPQL